jgi:flagellar hook-associated protein 1 FlgK
MSYLGSFFGLGLLGNALDTFQEATDVVSNDIANVNTPGASRQQVNIASMAPISGSPFSPANLSGGTFGNGSIVADIQRIHDNSYDGLFRGASSSQNYFSTQQSTLQSLQASLGEPNNGINSYFTAFQTSVSQLVNQLATGSSGNSGVISAAQSLTQALNSAANTINQQKAQVVQQAGTLVTQVNNILDQIAALNGQIRASTAAGDNANTYQDQRDYLIDQLSQYVSTQTSLQADGSALVTVNGQALVNDTVSYHLATPVIGTSSNGTPSLKVDFQSNPPAAANAPGIPLGSGQLAGLADLYNNKLTSYGQRLDSFASSMANEVNRITQSGYDQNGVPGVALFQPIVGSMQVSASNIKVGMTDPTQFPAALVSTSAGTLVQAMNSANNVVDTSAAINNNGSMANPPAAAGITGTLTVTVDGVAQTFTYNTNTTDSTIDGFISHFNSAHLGVTASFDATSQKIVFTRDPSNTDLVHRAAQQAAGTATNPTFTIADSNYNAGTPATSLLGVLNAGSINNVTQDSSNALGSSNNGAATALLNMFSANVGVPALQTASTTAIAAPGTYTIALPAGVANVRAGDLLTVDAQPNGAAPQENVVVSSVSVNPATGIESITATFTQAHAAGFSIASAQTQTLGQYYGQLVSQMGLATQTATTGASSQSTLAQNINSARQSVDGINIDEETQNLIKYQNAYQATARSINVLDQMLSTVINSLGAGH